MIHIDNVIELVETAKTPYWILYTKSQRGQGSSPRMYSIEPVEGSEQDMDESLDHLKKCLSYLVDGKYIIRTFVDEKQKKNNFFETEFVVTGRPTSNSTNNPNIAGMHNHSANHGIGGASIGEIVQEKVKAALDAKELAELRIQVSEMQQHTEDPSGLKTQVARMMGVLSDTAPHMIAPLMGEVINVVKGIAGFFRPATISGHPETHHHYPNQTQQQPPIKTDMNQEEIDEIQNELDSQANEYAAILLRLRLVDADLLNTLSKMASKAESNPKILDSLKMFL